MTLYMNREIMLALMFILLQRKWVLVVASRTIALIQNGIRCSWPERSCGS
jgi:hypothetical protein